MREVTAETAAEYLHETGRVPSGANVAVRELAGGVSNVVLRVDVEGQPPFVLKQSRERLRTKIDWFSRLDRIWTEVAAMRLLATVLPKGMVPAVLFDDPANYLFAMTCAPDDAVVWKAKLLAGEADPVIARLTGEALGAIHADLTDHPELRKRFANTDLFDQLRIDPYYRQLARVYPELKPTLDRLIDSMAEVPRKTLVLADFSPKNMLVRGRSLTLIDFETAHAGDPAFDLGFFLSHLLLKAFRASRAGAHGPYLELTRVFWEAYLPRSGGDAALIARSIQHASACVLARIDGKSPVDYCHDLDTDAIRRFARASLITPTSNWGRLVQSAALEMLPR